MISLSQEQRMLVDSLRDLSEKEFAENAFEWEGGFPAENLQLLADRGYLGLNFDEEYGGGGMTEFESLLMIETIGRVSPTTAQFVNNLQMIGGRALEMFATDAAKEKYLPPALAGEETIAVAISEPGAGSDVKAMNTTVEERDGELVLDGEKMWVSFVPESSVAVVWAMFDDGIGSVLMEFDSPGVEIEQHYTNMAGAPMTHFYINEVTIPEENVLHRGGGFKEQLKALNWERLGTVAFTNAMGLCAFDRALDYSQNRKQFDQPIGDFQGMRWKFADMAKELQVSRSLCFQSAQQAINQGRVPDPLSTNIVKLYSAEMIERVVSEALQVHGANGYQQGHPLEFLYRLARARRIGAGTDETIKNTVGSMLQKDGLPHL